VVPLPGWAIRSPDTGHWSRRNPVHAGRGGGCSAPDTGRPARRSPAPGCSRQVGCVRSESWTYFITKVATCITTAARRTQSMGITWVASSRRMAAKSA